MSEILEQRCITEQNHFYLKIILGKLKEGLNLQSSCTKLMKNLIQDLLDYAQINSGKFRINYQFFDIRETIKEIISIQMKQA